MATLVNGIFQRSCGLLLCIACITLAALGSEARAQSRLSRDMSKGGVYYSQNVTRTTSANVTTSSVLIAPENPRRKAIVVYNNSANSAYITYGPTSAGSTCTRILATYNQFEIWGAVVYTGPISAIRNSGSGTLTVTEIE